MLCIDFSSLVPPPQAKSKYGGLPPQFIGIDRILIRILAPLGCPDIFLQIAWAIQPISNTIGRFFVSQKISASDWSCLGGIKTMVNNRTLEEGNFQQLDRIIFEYVQVDDKTIAWGK